MKDELSAVGKAFTYLMQSVFSSMIGQDKHRYRASYGNENDLFSRSNDGFSIGNKQMSKEQSFSHFIVTAPSGGGKSTVCVLPFLLRQTNSSLLINDSSRELRGLSADYLESVGFKNRFLDFDVKKFTRQTSYFNILHRVKTKSDVAKLVSILMKTVSSDKGNDKFFTIQGGEAIAIAIEAVKRDPDERTHHAASVYRLLQLFMSDEERAAFYLAQWDDLFQRFAVLIGTSPNTKSSILSTAIAALSWVDTNPNLALLVSRDTISFSQLRKEKTAIFISVPLAYSEVYAPIINIFYSQFYASILESPLPQKGDLPIFCCLDEFGSSMYIEGYPKLASVLRKWRVGNLKILQSESQLEKYGRAGAKEILNSATKMYFTGLDDESERISKMLGSYSHKQGDYIKERLLMTPQEVRTMPKNMAIVVPNGGLKPMKVQLVPYYEQRELVRRSQIKTSDEQEELEITPELHLINIPELPNHLRDE